MLAQSNPAKPLRKSIIHFRVIWYERIRMFVYLVRKCRYENSRYPCRCRVLDRRHCGYCKSRNWNSLRQLGARRMCGATDASDYPIGHLWCILWDRWMGLRHRLVHRCSLWWLPGRRVLNRLEQSFRGNRNPCWARAHLASIWARRNAIYRQTLARNRSNWIHQFPSELSTAHQLAV